MEKETLKFEITEKDEGKRLDKFLTENLPDGRSRSFAQKLIRENAVTIGGYSAKSHHKLSRGESVNVVMPAPKESVIFPEDIPIDVVYEDGDVMVINKAPDMVVHPAPGNYKGTLVNALLSYCKNLSGIGGVLKPGIVHRLDKGTSGLILVAKTDRSHISLSKQFKAKVTKRRYVALVKGIVQLDNGLIELPIGRSPRDRKKMAVNFVSSKDAVTKYHVLKRFSHSTLVELTLLTGRTHQIRVHMAYIGHPVLGDAKYGTRGNLARPMLHAEMIGFTHPATGKYMEFKADMPDDMKELIDGKLL